MNSDVTTLIIAVLGTGAASAAVAAWFARRKVSSEATNLDANSAKTMTETAGELVQMVKATYEDRIGALERRIIETDQRAIDAVKSAAVAREAESQCRARLAV